MSNVQKFSSFSTFLDVQKRYLEAAGQIESHNMAQRRDDVSSICVNEFISHCKRYPDALIVMETPSQKALSRIADKLKYLFSHYPYKNVQPMVPYSGIISNEQLIVLYVDSEPMFSNFDMNEAQRFYEYTKGKDILKRYEKDNEEIIPTLESNATVWGYWINDVYFNKHGWKSLYTVDRQFVSVFASYVGNSSFELILDPHY